MSTNPKDSAPLCIHAYTSNGSLPSASSKVALLKLLLAGSIAGQNLEVAIEERSADPLTGESVFLEVGKGRLIANANAGVRALLPSSSTDIIASAQMISWMEWEESQLLGATFQTNCDQLLELLEVLGREPLAELLKGPWNAVQVAVFSTLHFARDKLERKVAVQAWLNERSQQEQIKSVLKRVDALSGSATTAAVKSGISIAYDHHERTILPMKGKRNVLITSALPYVNNVPHLGNIIGSVLSADVFARYCRARGYNTLFICGTDEYGTATETRALEEKVSEEELCAKYRALHKQTYDWFNIDFDFFGKTTTPAQTTICQDIFFKLRANGYTYEDTMTQLYCDEPGHKRFLADRFVEGECPNCHYEDARGDQCDNCGKLLEPTELLRPKCKLDGTTPILRETKHQFLDLPKLEEWNFEWAERVTEEGKWSQNGKTITIGWLRQGLTSRCITRDLKWGVPVPVAGYEDKVFYVWYDAPIGYISITMNYTADHWEEWWKNPENVKLYQFMGKDNVPFHSVIFPCILHGTKDPYTIVNTISTCEYLNYENGKFSKSRGVGVFGNNVMASNIPSEVWRYYLISSRPENSDSQFLWHDFVARNNSELLANLGNFVNRTLKFVAAKYQSTVPAPASFGANEVAFLDDVNRLVTQYIDYMEQQKERGALKLVMDISGRGNLYLQDSKLDNTLFAMNRATANTVLSLAINLIYLISALVYPFMPTTSEAIVKQLRVPHRRIPNDDELPWDGKDIHEGHVIGKPDYLFTKIEESKEQELRQRYAGKQVTEEGNGTTSAPIASSASVAPPKDAKSAKAAGKAKAAAKPSAKDAKPGKSAEPVITDADKTPEMIELELLIAEQGNKVRKLKGEKAPAELIKSAVDELLQFKARLGDLVKNAKSN
ncbi:hypothetical protein HDU93_001924 [Gonapodya sp. JEL0774]|nr:hypothetical protein HDU93_001924 [Gonapodya sp. JEL0774]